jgi:hypothetical protein
MKWEIEVISAFGLGLITYYGPKRNYYTLSSPLSGPRARNKLLTGWRGVGAVPDNCIEKPAKKARCKPIARIGRSATFMRTMKPMVRSGRQFTIAEARERS